MPVTDGGLDLWRPAVAVDGRGDVVVVWAQQTDGNWDLYRRSYTPAKGDGARPWSEIVRLTDDPGADFHAVAATDASGTVWVAWQAWRRRQLRDPRHVAGRGRPAAVALVQSRQRLEPDHRRHGKGNVFVAWDTYEQGNYDVRLRAAADGDRRRSRSPPRPASRPGRRLPATPPAASGSPTRRGTRHWGKDYANATPDEGPLQQSAGSRSTSAARFG